VWEFVNLYSRDRGCNRFFAIQKALQPIAERDEFAARGLKVDNTSTLNAWLKEESKLGNPALEAKVKATGDPFLKMALAWSMEVNARIEDLVFDVPPFPMVRESLAKIRPMADVIVVSQTPVEALEREWNEHGIDGLVDFIAGQEAGTKAEHIRYATGGRYAPDRILMIGDAQGDLKAAKDNAALFFPIIPGREEQPWKRLFEEGADKFFAGGFAGQYQAELITEFDAALPAKVPWQK
jgi:phosphoglycolate phosphatase-like HAD superfamily hydrolase